MLQNAKQITALQ